MQGFKKCDNGHYYKGELASCPYCSGSDETVQEPDAQEKTEAYTKPDDGNKTRLMIPGGMGAGMSVTPSVGNKTVFGDEVVRQIEGKEEVQKEYRIGRKLVGWLATFSFDPLGADFRLYEGRNVIGRDNGCNIVVPDKTMSGRHATILFKNDRYKIKDELSSHGTLVNGADIEDNTVELNDGDLITMGETVFTFKTVV
jgi:hypothetical protein